MPLVKIELTAGKDKAYKKGYIDCVNKALSKAFGIPYDDCSIRLYEMDKDFLNVKNTCTDKFSLIEITCLPGRSQHVKKNAILAINHALNSEFGIEGNDLFITFNEPPLDNWSIDGSQASMLKLNYKTE